ncbi:MAG: type II toxin-antitoxin system RelE/ParE family toxin [Microbacteriaceae bacterium]|nr:type II toxin-antitoxin system RelE/ParE family toxin [Microbacteriaceae bacterium]
MKYTVRLLANAQRDLAEVEAYYEEHAPHETDRCLDAIEAALDWIAMYAHQPAESRFGLRHVSVDTFHYAIWYRLFEQERYAQVIAVLHHRRGEDALSERAL